MMRQLDSHAVAEASISAIAAAYGLTPRAIRYYEVCGLIDSQRDEANRRTFGVHARDRLLLIARLRNAGLRLNEFAPILDLEAQGRRVQLGAALDALRGKLRALEAAEIVLRGTIADMERELAQEAAPRGFGAGPSAPPAAD
ncbi:MAG: MerR family transcriptional regulator [Phenylobacterium sp.]|uniref:MerR family transcriptional regulator n=1 Tax=Phenylobacterium sp. TaxID=1871053 RepID=UPI0025F9F1B1|nr:MerR family transcriptional regulator [Phenylobacterium sp.]MBI1196795.1 MerR family transcriptional regulator [Phenylobacterium sp.]